VRHSPLSFSVELRVSPSSVCSLVCLSVWLVFVYLLHMTCLTGPSLALVAAASSSSIFAGMLAAVCLIGEVAPLFLLLLMYLNLCTVQAKMQGAAVCARAQLCGQQNTAKAASPSPDLPTSSAVRAEPSEAEVGALASKLCSEYAASYQQMLEKLRGELQAAVVLPGADSQALSAAFQVC
jgi:hypothetical protein